jgi:hypothetical protein
LILLLLWDLGCFLHSFICQLVISLPEFLIFPSLFYQLYLLRLGNGSFLPPRSLFHK